MDQFYNNYEQAICSVFKMYPEDMRENIQALYEKETADKQAALEAEALKKYEQEKALEEQKQAQEAPAKGAKKAAPPKGKKGPDVPELNVPQLQVPSILEFSSEMGNKYLIERSVQDIAHKIVTEAPKDDKEDEENKQDGDQPAAQQE